MSSNDGVFLYVGIVAIWAGFLIPAWIRRPHASDLGPEADVDAHAQGDAPTQRDGQWGESVARAADSQDAADADRLEFGGHSAATPPEYGEQMPDYAEDVPWSAGEPAAGRSPAGQSPAASRSPAAGASASRRQMMRARRRMLTILVALCLVTGGFVVLAQVQWWICVPPAGMLVLYVLLLREIAMADAELASKRAAWESRAALRAHAAREERAARQWQNEGWSADAAEQSAEIIDISGRIGDQLYDQYADAAVRAVGD